MQTPLTQSPEEHALPQPPQFAGSCVKSVQTGPPPSVGQHERLAAVQSEQLVVQTPQVQVTPVAHASLQAPQLSGSDNG